MSRPSMLPGGHTPPSATDTTEPRSRVSLNLFWRTFFLLALLLLGLAWGLVRRLRRRKARRMA